MNILYDEIHYIDETTKEKYKVYVDNGELKIEKVVV